MPLRDRWIDLAATVTCIIVTIVTGGVITVQTTEYVLHTQLLHIEHDNPKFVSLNLSFRLVLLFMFWLIRIIRMIIQ